MDKLEEAYPMSAKKYHVSLTEAERTELVRLSKSQRHSERERKRARILLLADEAQEGGADKDADIAQQVKVAPLTVNRVRQRFAERGLHKSLAHKSLAHKSLAHKSLAHKSLAHKSLAHKSLAHKEQETRKPRVLDGEAEACLVALTCGTPPEGQARWSLRLLKDALIEQQIVDAIGKETVRQTLKKTRLNRG